MKQKFTAFLHCNKRDTNFSPKALMTNIIISGSQEKFRDHSWVNLSKALEKIQPCAGNNSHILITFTAKPVDYLSTDSEGTLITKQRLTRISNIKII